MANSGAGQEVLPERRSCQTGDTGKLPGKVDYLNDGKSDLLSSNSKCESREDTSETDGDGQDAGAVECITPEAIAAGQGSDTERKGPDPDGLRKLTDKEHALCQAILRFLPSGRLAWVLDKLLTEEHHSVRNGRMGSKDEDEEELPAGAMVSAQEDFANATFDEIVRRFTPQIPQAVLARMENLIREARPVDVAEYAKEMNTVLKRMGLQVYIDGRRASLVENGGCLMLGLSGGGTRGVRSTPWTLVHDASTDALHEPRHCAT